jgi:hypothetical protein
VAGLRLSNREYYAFLSGIGKRASKDEAPLAAKLTYPEQAGGLFDHPFL